MSPFNLHLFMHMSKGGQLARMVTVLPAIVLQTLHRPESGDGVEQLHLERSQRRAPMQEEEEATRPRVLHRALDEVHDRVALEVGGRAKAEVAC